MFRRFAIAALAFGLAAGVAHAQTKPTLTVYTYGSFAGKYGPGKTVKERFESRMRLRAELGHGGGCR